MEAQAQKKIWVLDGLTVKERVDTPLFTLADYPLNETSVFDSYEEALKAQLGTCISFIAVNQKKLDALDKSDLLELFSNNEIKAEFKDRHIEPTLNRVVSRRLIEELESRELKHDDIRVLKSIVSQIDTDGPTSMLDIMKDELLKRIGDRKTFWQLQDLEATI